LYISIPYSDRAYLHANIISNSISKKSLEIRVRRPSITRWVSSHCSPFRESPTTRSDWTSIYHTMYDGKPFNLSSNIHLSCPFDRVISLCIDGHCNNEKNTPITLRLLTTNLKQMFALAIASISKVIYKIQLLINYLRAYCTKL
jgi:hypothetical protein